jgi:hypothetical protein
MKRNITSKSRGRYLTPEEVEKYRVIGEQIEREQAEINARIRAVLKDQNKAKTWTHPRASSKQIERHANG